MRMLEVFGSHNAAERDRFMRTHEPDAWLALQEQEVVDDKERKKDMQRKRRREKSLATEWMKRDAAMQAAHATADAAERARFIREADRAARKARQTTQLLQGSGLSHDLRDFVTPSAPNFEGGTMGSFPAADEPVAREGSTRKRASGRNSTGRPKKSREQKLAEKANAAAAQAAIERGDSLPPIAPMEEARLEALQRDGRDLKAVKSRSAPQDRDGRKVWPLNLDTVIDFDVDGDEPGDDDDDDEHMDDNDDDGPDYGDTTAFDESDYAISQRQHSQNE